MAFHEHARVGDENLATTIPCPDCGTALSGLGSSCAACGLPLTGVHAARLWQIDQQLAALTLERRDVLAALRATMPVLATEPRLTPEPSRPVRRWTGPQVLLAGGAVLVLAAASIFLAVTWQLIGVAGQVLVMAALSAAAAGTAIMTARAGLRATAESFGALTAGMLLLDLTAARGLGLPVATVGSDAQYACAAGVLAAALLAGLCRVGAPLRTFALGAQLAASSAVTAALSLAPNPPSVSAGALAAAVAFAAAGRWLPATFGPLRRSATGPALLWSVVATAAAAWGALGGAWPSPVLTGVEAASILMLAVVAVAAVALLRLSRPRWDEVLDRPLSRQARLRVAAALLGVIAGALALSAPGWQLGPVVAAVVAFSTSVAVAAAVSSVRISGWTTGWPTGRWTGWPLTLAWVVVVVSLGGHLCATVLWQSQGAAALVLAAAAVALAPLLNIAATRPVGAGVVPLLAGAALWCGADLAGGATAAASLAGFALVLAVTAVLAPLGHTVRLSLDAVSTGWFVVAAVLALDESAPLAVGVLTTAGLVTCWRAVTARPAAAPAAAWLTAALWVALHDSGVTLLEAYTWPAAAFAAGAAAWWGRGTRAGSWLLAGPSLVLMLLPSLVSGIDGDRTPRLLLTAAVAVAAMVLGARLLWQAPLLLGAAAAVLVALTEAGPYAVAVPRWLTLAALGAVLLAAGARYEAGRAGAARALGWVSRMR